jgi:hypothetical protein
MGGVLTTTPLVPNVFILKIQAMNPNIYHTTTHVNYQTTWSQLVTLITPSKTSMLPTSTYPMWYNVMPPFMPLDPSLYPSYLTRTKGLMVEAKFNSCKIFHTNNSLHFT